MEIAGATAVATGVIAATIAEDVVSGGYGTVDDPASFAFAFKVIENAFAY